jgi:hypothetical protein
MEFGLMGGKADLGDDFTKETGLDPKKNLTEYLLYCNVRMTEKVNDGIIALDKRIKDLEGMIEKMPEDFIRTAEERRRKRNTL